MSTIEDNLYHLNACDQHVEDTKQIVVQLQAAVDQLFSQTLNAEQSIEEHKNTTLMIQHSEQVHLIQLAYDETAEAQTRVGALIDVCNNLISQADTIGNHLQEARNHIHAING